MMFDRRVAEAQAQLDAEADKNYRRDQVREMVVDAIVNGWTSVEIGDRVEDSILDAFGDYVLEMAQQWDPEDDKKSKAKYHDAYCLAVWTIRKGDTDNEIRVVRCNVAIDFVNDNFDAWEHLV
jgi:hypothetical protein